MKIHLLHSIRILILTGALLGTSACHDLVFRDEPADHPRALFDELWNTFRESYAPFAERGVDWDEAYATYANKVTDATGEEELYAVITEMLRPLDDGHVQLTTPGRQVFFANRYYREKIDDDLFDLELIKDNYLRGPIRTGADEEYTYGQLEGNLVYLHLDFIGPHLTILNKVLNEYPGARGLIIDLRHNRGGDFTWAFGEMGRLVDQRRLVFRSRTKNGPGREDYTPWHDWYIEPSGNPFAGKVVVLTDRYTISAGERTAMAFKVLPAVALVGDTTNGAHSTMIGRELANGWAFTLATQQVQFADGRSYEGIGVIPDIVVRNTRTQIDQGVDAVLERALAEF